MNDGDTTIHELKEAYAQFVAERKWQQFHSPKNLVMGLSVEAAELMEHFLWMENAESRDIVKDHEKMTEVSDEIADVAAYLFCLCNSLSLDLSAAVTAKLKKTAKKYPADKYQGKYRL